MDSFKIAWWGEGREPGFFLEKSEESARSLLCHSTLPFWLPMQALCILIL